MAERIPKILHFCFGMTADFGGKPFGLAHYVSVRSAIEQIKPREVFVYYQYEPDTDWWRQLLPRITAVKIEAPVAIFGNPIAHPAHRADVVRLEKLIERGGIYLDCDVLVQKSFDDLLSYSVVLGQQGRVENFGLANAIILAERNAPFLLRWYREYRTFRGDGNHHWDEHSVVLPLYLSRKFPAEIKVLPFDAFFYPLWTADHVEWMFDSTRPIDLSRTYANHFWESRSWRYIDRLTPADVRRVDTNFHRWARPYVADLSDDFGGSAQLNFADRRPSRAHLLGERALQWLRDQKARLPLDVSRFSTDLEK